jgi:hypothetical protein
MADDNAAFAPRMPDAVRRASRRADELAREAGVANVAELEPAEPTVTTVVTEPAPGEAPVPAAAEPPTQAPAPPPSSTPTTDWEQRYNSLQGKYNTELPELRGRVQSLQELRAAMQAAPREAPAVEPTRPPVAGAPLAPREIPSEDVEAYGQELITASQRWAENKWAPVVHDLERRLLLVEGGNHQNAQLAAQARVEAALDREVANWQQINIDPGFVAWLGQVDPFSGQLRKKLITEAHGAGDAARTIAFFRAYRDEHTAVNQSPGTQPHQTGEPPAEPLPLDSLVVPGRGQTAAPANTGAPDKRTWTNAQIAAFYRDKQRGLWANREAEAERVERDIIAASVEGRIRQ